MADAEPAVSGRADDPDDGDAVGRRVRRLKGRVAIVTGSDSGIGKAIAEALALEGAHVAVTYHSDEQGASDTVRQVEAAGCRALLQKLDVRDEASVAELFGSAEHRLGLPSILVNNAGMGFQSRWRR